MKRRKNNIFLLFVVVAIWGVLIYKLVATINPDTTAINSSPVAKFTPPKVTSKEAFTLLPLERDPFLGTLYKKKNTQVGKAKKSTIKKTEEKPWPTITYQGLVSDTKSSSQVFMVTIGGNQHLVKQGEVINDFKIIKGSSNSISLRFNGITKEITLQ
jgi:hypothetical protein